ncbi:MAG: ribonuclease P protein component 1 [Candidatus Aenigmarchaeota archaeon]|nr:ribonuclease P protein component 1 [Candidatus Aenigmarchaeota archaeon]
MIKAKNILQHELIGLDCTVIRSGNKSQIGIKGKIVDETLRTLIIETEHGLKKILKDSCVFRMNLKGQNILVEGSYLIARPEDRIKKKIRKW